MSLAITYFDYDGSRGLECRLALTLAGVPFEDRRVRNEEWAALKSTTPYGALPVLSRDGRDLAHSTAILTWVGRTYGLHPADPWRAAEHEAVMNAVEDLRNKVPSGREMSSEQKQAARADFAAGWLQQWCRAISESITGPFLDGDTLQVADLKLYVIVRGLSTGGYDHIDGSAFDAWPKIRAHLAAVEAHPVVRGYLAGR